MDTNTETKIIRRKKKPNPKLKVDTTIPSDPSDPSDPTEPQINGGGGRKLQYEAIFQHAERISNEITEFNPKLAYQETQHPFNIFLASRRSGKTYTLRDILYNAKHKWDNVLLFSNTKDFNVEYAYIPDENKYTTTDMKSIIENIIEEQKSLKKEGKEMKDYAFILDDVLDDSTIRKRNDNIVQTLSTQGRHLHLSVFLLVQGSKGITPMTRKNADYIYISRSRDGNELESFLKTYLTGEMECSQEVANQQRLAKAIYGNVLDKHDFGFLVIHNTKQNTKGYKDFLYWYVASSKPPSMFSIIKKERRNKKDEKSKDNRFEMTGLFRENPLINGGKSTKLTVGLLKLTTEEVISKKAMSDMFRKEV